jgi:hypothetical protein
MAVDIIELGYAVQRWWDRLTGEVRREAARLAAEIDWSNHVPGCPVVLCLDRALFRKDVAVLRKRTPFSYVDVSAKRLKRFQERWVAPKWRLQTYFTGYLEGPQSSVKPLLEQFGIAFLQAASRRHPIAGVLSGNFDYWQDDALKIACHCLGIPFFVLCRENYVWEAGVDYMKDRIADSKYRFLGAGVAVASEATNRSLSGSGGFDDGVLTITGFPRFDEWVGLAAVPTSERRTITLFSFADPLYLAPQTFAEVLEAFVGIAERYGDRLDFVIKMKKPNEVDELIGRFPQVKGKPIRITADPSVIDLARRSRAIIGFNSLVILESLLTEVPIVVPWWGDSVRGLDECVMHADLEQDRRYAYFPESSEALAALIEQAAQGTLPIKGTRQGRIARFSEQSLFSEQRAASDLVAKMLSSRIKAA